MTNLKKKRQRDFLRFVKLSLRRWGRVLLFADNEPAHHGKLVEVFCSRHRKTFRIEHFPAYSPELNPIEQC